MFVIKVAAVLSLWQTI